MMEPRQRNWIPCALAVFCAVALLGQEIRPRLVGEILRASTKGVAFLSGKQLDAVRNGATVSVDLQLTLLTETRGVAARGAERFVFSYDIWEERYSVVQMTSRAGVSNLTLEAAQQWCIDKMGISIAGLNKAAAYRVRLEIRADEPRRRSKRDQDDPPIALGALVDIFSRPARSSQKSWQLESAPFRLDSLK
jgi:hypothetical protein